MTDNGDIYICGGKLSETQNSNSLYKFNESLCTLEPKSLLNLGNL